MMHPLHDYVVKQLGEKLKSRKVVVGYDVRREFAPFVAEVRGSARASSEAVRSMGVRFWRNAPPSIVLV
jgi:hypothetical protein